MLLCLNSKAKIDTLYSFFILTFFFIVLVIFTGAFADKRDLINDNALVELLFFNDLNKGELIVFIDEKSQYYYFNTVEGEEDIRLGYVNSSQVKNLLSISTTSRFYGEGGAANFPHNNEEEKTNFMSLYIKDSYETLQMSTTRLSGNYGISEVEHVLFEDILNKDKSTEVSSIVCSQLAEKSGGGS